LDTENIKAHYADRVLTLRLPVAAGQAGNIPVTRATSKTEQIAQ
jgi:hypothetical protein